MSGGGVSASMPAAEEMSIGCMGTLDTFRASFKRGSQPCAHWMGDTSSRQTPHGKLRTYSDRIGDARGPLPRRSMAVQGCCSGRVLSDPRARPLSVKSGVGGGGGGEGARVVAQGKMGPAEGSLAAGQPAGEQVAAPVRLFHVEPVTASLAHSRFVVLSSNLCNAVAAFRSKTATLTRRDGGWGSAAGAVRLGVRRANAWRACDVEGGGSHRQIFSGCKALSRDRLCPWTPPISP